MKRTFPRTPFSGVLAAATLLLAPAAARAEHYKLFVLTGQSNSLGTTNGSEPDVSPGADPADSRVKFWWHNVADATTSIGDSGGAFTGLQVQQGGYYPGSATHWGPEIGFGRTLVRAGVENVVIVKASRGGGGNTHWSKSSGGHMYSHVVSTVNAAAAALTGDGHTFETAGLLYLQGESDNAAEAESAGTRLLELIANLRADLPHASGMKVVVGGIAASGADRDKVRVGQEQAAAGSPDISFFPNLDLRDSVTDGLHFDKAAKLRIGERFAQAFFAHGTVSRRYGKLVFIGDSITQGGNGDHPSYRYQVFKRLAEQGVPIDPVAGYKFTGSVTGPQTTAVLTTPDVNGQTFENVHDGHYGWRASWINARVRLPANRRSSNRGEGTLLNWTGQASPQTYLISGPDQSVPYPDPSASDTGNTGVTYIPDTVSVMIGINDLADNNSATGQLVDDIATIIDQLRAANPQVRIFINRILYTNQTQALRNAVDTVNGMLPGMIAAKNASSPASPVWLVDAATGFDPVTMTYDAIHPNALGEAYVGDRIAAALGVIETPGEPEPEPPPHQERDSAAFGTRHEGNQIWNGSAFVNGWTQVGELTKSLPEPTDLRVIHPAAEGRWLEGTGAGWSSVLPGSWTFEIRLKCNANANGVMLWFGTGSQRILVEVHGDRTQDMGGESFNVAHNNLDGEFHVYRVVNDASNGKYHVFRDGRRITPIEGAAYDQNSADNRLIIGDYTSVGTFGNGFDITIDHVRFTSGAWLPPGVDSDGNGLPDAWEYEYFGVLTGTDPNGDADEDGFTNLEEFQNGTHPLMPEASSSTLQVFLLAGAGNAHGIAGETPLSALPPGMHPAEQEGGVWFHDDGEWKVLSAATDGSHGPEIAFARLLWDAGHRGFGIVKSTTLSGGNSEWVKGAAPGNAYDLLVDRAQAAASSPPGDFTDVHFRALVYVQGEGNDAAEADAAGTRFAALLENLRSDLPGAAGMKGILGEIGGTGTDRDTTRARHAALAAERSDIGYARATGAFVQNSDGLGIHYDADGIHLLGARLAAEALDLGLAPAPLPSWTNVHAWFIADHATGFDTFGAVARWSSVRNGSGVRDLSRRVADRTYRRSVTSGSGHARQVMRFDGTNDLWSNASNEFGTISGARSVAILCRVMSEDDGFLFDGSTGTGKSRVQIRDGRWQVGVSTASDPWNGAENDTVAVETHRWQQHVFVFTPAGGGTSVEHWIDGELVGTASDPATANLGGFMIGGNGGSPFSRIKADVAEVAVFSAALDESDIAALKSAWNARWGSPTGPPFSVLVTQNPREIARFGRHELVGLKIETPSATTVDGVIVQLSPGTPEAIESLAVIGADGRSTLAVIDAPVPDSLSIPLSVPLGEGSHQLQIAVVPKRRAALGTALDASITGVVVAGEEVLPDNADPAGVVTLGLVPQFTDVVKSGDLGINTFRIPGIVIDGRGVMHAVYDHRYDHSGDLPANIDVGYSRSSDGGATWTTSRSIIDFDHTISGSSGNGVGDPCILHDPVTDTLWVAALWSFGNRAYNGSGPGLTPEESGQYVLVKSEDGGDTWSAPINITAQVKDPAWRLIFCGPGHGLAMRDGTLVFPSQYRDENGTVRTCSVYSTDHGQSWKFGSAVPTASPQTNENTVCELDDGRLLFSMRTPVGSNGQRAWIHYTPGGGTAMSDGEWGSLFRLPSVPDPVCQGSVIQWTSRHRGDPRELVVFGNPASSSSRVDFTLWVSADGGNSWPVSRLLYGGPSAYSSICILPDRSIGILFEKDNYTKITFARVEMDWLLDPSADSDGDGMPDAWELLHGLNPSIADGDDDSDGDGITNLDEFTAGTDPLDAASAFVATTFIQEEDEGWRFGWRAVPGKFYLIESSDDLETWSPVLHIVADRSEMSALIPADANANRKFVRAKVLR